MTWSWSASPTVSLELCCFYSPQPIDLCWRSRWNLAQHTIPPSGVIYKPVERGCETDEPSQLVEQVSWLIHSPFSCSAISPWSGHAASFAIFIHHPVNIINTVDQRHHLLYFVFFLRGILKACCGFSPPLTQTDLWEISWPESQVEPGTSCEGKQRFRIQSQMNLYN